MEVAASRGIGLKIASTLEGQARLRRGSKISRAARQFTPLDPAQLIGQLWIVLLVGLEQGRPCRVELSAALPYSFLEMLSHAVRHQEFRVLRPTVGTLGETNLFLAKRLAVGLLRILLMRRSISDMTIHND